MSDIYAAPEAELGSTEIQQQPFYVVSHAKFTVLYFATFSVYGIYWFYKHWAQQKNYNDEQIIPFWRAVFRIFFVHSLFSRIEMAYFQTQPTTPWKSAGIASAYIVLLVVSFVLERLAYESIGSPYTDTLGLFVLIPEYLILIKVQMIANLVSGDPAGATNRNITAANIAWIVLGVVMWAFALVGFYFLFTDPAAL